MCTYSAIVDNINDRIWPKIYPDHPIDPWYPNGIGNNPIFQPEVSKKEFDDLAREVRELRKLLEAAKKFDEATNQKDCEHESKLAILRKICEALGIDPKDVIV